MVFRPILKLSETWKIWNSEICFSRSVKSWDSILKALTSLLWSALQVPCVFWRQFSLTCSKRHFQGSEKFRMCVCTHLDIYTKTRSDISDEYSTSSSQSQFRFWEYYIVNVEAKNNVWIFVLLRKLSLKATLLYSISIDHFSYFHYRLPFRHDLYFEFREILREILYWA